MAAAFRQSFSASSSSCGVPAPRWVSARCRERCCWAFLAGDRFWTTAGDLGDGVVGHLADQQLFADAVFLDEFFGLSLGDSQLDELTQVLRLGLLHAQLGIDRVELDQGLTRLDPVADVVMNLDDPAGPFRAQRSPAPSHAGCR